MGRLEISASARGKTLAKDVSDKITDNAWDLLGADQFMNEAIQLHENLTEIFDGDEVIVDAIGIALAGPEKKDRAMMRSAKLW